MVDVVPGLSIELVQAHTLRFAAVSPAHSGIRFSREKVRKLRALAMMRGPLFLDPQYGNPGNGSTLPNDIKHRVALFR